MEAVADEYAEAIQKGVGWLNKTKPYWFQAVDLRALDMGNTACVLYQLDLATRFDHEFGLHAWAEYGFDMNSMDREGYYELTEAWRAEILRQRELSSAS